MTGIEGQNLTHIIKTYASALLAMSNIRICYILLIALLITYFINRKHFLSILRNNIFWLVAVAVLYVFIVFTKHDTAHSRFGIEVFSLIVLVRMALTIPIPKPCCILLNAALCFYIVLALPACKQSYDEYNSQISQIKDKSNYIITTHEIKTPCLYQRFIVPNPSEASVVPWIINYYHRGDFVFLPNVFVTDVKQHPEHYDSFYTTKDLPFYVQRIEKGRQIVSVTFQLRPSKKAEIPLLQRPFANQMERFSAMEMPTNKFRMVNLYGETYLIVDKNRLIDFRVKDISYTLK